MVGRCSAFLAVFVAAVSVALAVTSVALAILVPIPPFVPSRATMPGCNYAWAQPMSASVSIRCAQPPAWIPIAVVMPPLPSSSYAWAQPGTASTWIPLAQPPAWIRAG